MSSSSYFIFYSSNTDACGLDLKTPPKGFVTNQYMLGKIFQGPKLEDWFNK